MSPKHCFLNETPGLVLLWTSTSRFACVYLNAPDQAGPGITDPDTVFSRFTWHTPSFRIPTFKRDIEIHSVMGCIEHRALFAASLGDLSDCVKN